jgi:Protein of unknown function (DUF3800)
MQPGILWHAYIDESGDRGWTPRSSSAPLGKRMGSSRNFSMTAVLVPDGIQNGALGAWRKAMATINRPSGAMIHWQNVKTPGQRKLLVDTIRSIPGVQTISVVLCKFHLPNVSRLTDPEYLYHWPLRLLVERISFFGEHRGDTVAMWFSQVRGLNPRRTQRYLRGLRGDPTCNIEWSHLLMPPKIDTAANRPMLQLADTASGAVFAAFEPDPYGYTDQVYLDMLKPVIWCRPWRKLHQDGLKFGPWPSPCKAEHTWFDAFCA